MLGLIIKIARPRTWVFIVLAYLIGWGLTGSNFSANYIIGMIVFVIWVASVNIINAYTDYNEDKINLPQRVQMIEQVGYNKLPYIVAGTSILCLLLSLTINFNFLIIVLIAIFDGLFYSLKPLRFKSNPVLSLISFSGAVVLPLIGAWVITMDLSYLPMLFIFLGYSFLVYGTVKNLPDYYGDRETNLNTTATVFKTRRKAIAVATILLLSPYALLIGLVYSEIIDQNFLWLLTLLPFIALICYRALTKSKSENLEKLHTYGFFYQAGILSITMFLVTNLLYAIIIVSTTLSVTFAIQYIKIDSR
jgi:4-hydroxybenzoate polyprenyltransferase